MRKIPLAAMAALVVCVIGSTAAHATRVDVTAPGNLLALLPTGDLAASTVSVVAFGLPSVVNNLVGTSNQDDGLVFLDTDTDERLAITGFDSALTDIRFFTSPGDAARFPSSITVYYSTQSTLSLDAADTPYAGVNGGLLQATVNLTSALFTSVPGSTNGYIDLSVNAPAGTQTLLFNFGSANGTGDRVGEMQAFDLPEPNSLLLLASLVPATLMFGRRRKR
jgi:hypothetical protein